MTDLGDFGYCRTSFKSMNTDILVLLDPVSADKNYETLVQNWFETNEARFSRFRNDSELNMINRSEGWTLVSAAMLEVLQMADQYRIETDGLFNPGILSILEAVGYDSTFDHITSRNWESWSQPKKTSPDLRVSQANYIVHPGMRSVMRIGSARIDLGGIVKGWCVERLKDFLKNHYRVPRGLIDAGGDIAVWGGSAEVEPWVIGLQEPWKGEEIASIALRDGSIATSGTLKRQWKHLTGSHYNHLIDPRSMDSCRSDIIQCTIIGLNTIDCEIAAKTVCLLGCHEGLQWLDKQTKYSEAVIFTKSGHIHYRGTRKSLKSRWQSLCPDVFHEMP